MLNVSSDENVKYVTFKREESFYQAFRNFLSSIGISKEYRKNLFKSHNSFRRGDHLSEGYTDTLQVVTNENETIRVEIFTGTGIIITAIHYSEKEMEIGENPLKYFNFNI